MNTSTVFIFGSIMPEPLAIPPMRTPSTSTATCFSMVSVVMIALAAASLPPDFDVNPFITSFTCLSIQSIST